MAIAASSLSVLGQDAVLHDAHWEFKTNKHWTRMAEQANDLVEQQWQRFQSTSEPHQVGDFRSMHTPETGCLRFIRRREQLERISCSIPVPSRSAPSTMSPKEGASCPAVVALETDRLDVDGASKSMSPKMKGTPGHALKDFDAREYGHEYISLTFGGERQAERCAQSISLPVSPITYL